MAGAAHDHTRGEMDIAEQVSTFEFFNGMTKWGSLGLASLLLFLVLMFCTGTGFIGSAISVAVFVTIGVVLLREKPQAAH